MKSYKIKSVAVLVLVSLCFSLCSCEFADTVSSVFSSQKIIEDTSLVYTHIDKNPFIYSIYYKPYICRDSYNLLKNDGLKKLYDLLTDSVYSICSDPEKNSEYKTKQVILEDYLLSEADIRITVKALQDDNPQIFWLTNTFGFLTSKDNNYTAVQLYSYASPDTVSLCIMQLKTVVNDFYAKLDIGMTPYQLEKAVHDYIINTCEYDESLLGDINEIPKDKFNSFNPYGVLVSKSAVCEGYSRAFQMLLCGIGVRCINIIGTSENELHMWNAVELNDDWYYVDITWDDNDKQGLKYDYFNINEDQIKTDHEFSKLYTQLSDEQICGDEKTNALTSNYYIPECNATEYNYYVREAAHLSDYDDCEAVVNSLTKVATNKEKYFNFYIDPDELTYDDAIVQLFYSYPQYFFDYVDKVNNSLPDFSIDEQNLSMYEKKHLNVVLVILEYV